MKNILWKKYKILAVAVLMLYAALSGAAAQMVQKQKIDFVEMNRPTFRQFTLSNGIPVYVKENKANKVRNISFVLRGGSLTIPQDKAGWPLLAFKTAARASVNYPYAVVTDLLDETSSSISASATFEYTALSLNVLDKYFAKLLPVWADMVTQPAFAKSDFDQVKSEAVLNIQSKDQNPWAKTNLLTNQKFFEGHPYAANPDGTEATIGKAQLDLIKAWYAENLSADRAFIVAVGDFSSESLETELEKTFAAIPNLKLGPVPEAPAFAKTSQGRLFIEEDEQSRGVVYMRGDFAAPNPGSADYFSASLAMKLFSDLLFTIVRDQYGAVYTPGSYIRSFGANYGSITIYKTSATEKIKSYIDEAAGVMADGRCVSVDPSRPGEESKFMKIPDALEAYKQMFKNEYFNALRTNSAMAGMMIRSVIDSGDPADWIMDVQRIQAVTPGQILEAFSHYVLEGGFTWVALGDPGLLGKLNPADFTKIGK
ncbi:MAG: insulinase family protein [Spirochaetia bacterium]|nr:insulinase family protein [Spirochaetia bacterium]